MKATIDELQVFVSVVDSGSLTAAAEQLGHTVSAMSRSLRRLEGKLEVTLLLRTTRRVQLSEEGALYLGHARHILQTLDEAEEQLVLRREQPVGRLRVDAASPFMLHCIVPHVAEFSRLYPAIELELSSNERNIDLLEQRVDIAIRIGALADSSLHARALGASSRRLLASPAYLAEHGEPHTLAALSGHRLLGFTDLTALNHWPVPDAQGQWLKIVPALAASSGETLRQLALAGVGIVCLADFVSAADVQAGRLRPLLEDLRSDAREPINAVYYRNSALAARISCFLEFFAARVQL